MFTKSSMLDTIFYGCVSIGIYIVSDGGGGGIKAAIWSEKQDEIF